MTHISLRLLYIVMCFGVVSPAIAVFVILSNFDGWSGVYWEQYLIDTFVLFFPVGGLISSLIVTVKGTRKVQALSFIIFLTLMVYCTWIGYGRFIAN